MTGLRWSSPLVSLVLCAALAPAQGVIITGGSYGYARGKSSKSLSLSLNGIVVGGSYGYGPSPYASPGYSASGFFPSGSRYTVIYSGPQVVATPINLQQMADAVYNSAPPDTGLRHIPERRRDRVEDLPPPAAAAPPPAAAAVPPQPPPPAPLPGQNTGVFRPIGPDERDRARQPVLPEPEPEPQPPPKPAPPPGTKLIDQGRMAFAEGEYGRAADHFRRAVAAADADPLPRFLLVETLTALGKYTAAAEAARSAAERFRDWPALTVRPLDLYGARSADFTEHLKQLEQTRAAHPGDPALSFLTAHTLWFAGRKDEARDLFRRAAPNFPAAERFLKPLPPGVI